MVHKVTPNFIQMAENASPTNPPSGHVGIYFKADGLAYQRNSSGLEIPLGGGVVVRDWYGEETDLSADKLIFPRGSIRDLGSNTPSLDLIVNGRKRRCQAVYATENDPLAGYDQFNQMISVFTAAAAAGSLQTDSRYCSASTDAVNGTKIGWGGGAIQFNSLWGKNSVIEGVIRTSTLVTLCRIWFGMFAPGTSPAGDTLIADGVGFRYSTTAGDAGWTPCTFDTSQTTGTTIGTVALSTRYLLRIRIVDTTAYFSVNNGTEQAISTQVPTSGGMGFGFMITTLSAAIRSILMSRIQLESDY